MKKAELFVLSQKVGILQGQIKKEELAGNKLKERLKLKNMISRKLTKKLEAFRINMMGEEPIAEDSNESNTSESEENNTSSENELPIPLEKLSNEVQKIMITDKQNSKFTKSYSSSLMFSKLKSTHGVSLEKSSSGYYSEYSGLEEDYSIDSMRHSEKNWHEHSENDASLKRIKWTANDASKECEVCGRDFNWYRWRHHCRRCGKYFFIK